MVGWSVVGLLVGGLHCCCVALFDGSLIGWSVGRFVGWWVDLLVSCLVGGLHGCLVAW